MRYTSRPSFPRLPIIHAFLFGLCIAALGSLTTTAQAQTYTLTDLGTLGGSQSTATDVNNSGQVVGNSLTSDGSTHAFLSGADGGSLTDLGIQVTSVSELTGAPYTTTGISSYALGINNKGQIAGYVSDVNGADTGFVSNPNGGTLNGLNIGAGEFASVVVGINDKGQVAGGSSENLGFFYDLNAGSNSTIHYQGFAPTVINDQGQILGDIPFASESALTGPNGGQPGYGVDNLGAIHYSTFDVNDTGQVAGASQTQTPGGYQITHAFLTGPNGKTATDLGSLDPNLFTGGANSAAHGVNNKDQVVGTSGTALSYDPNRAFLYENGVMTDLNSLIAPGAELTLTDATAISDTGFIVGTGTDEAGLTHAFLLSPIPVPEASTTVSLGLLLALGMGGLVIARKKNGIAGI